MITQTIPVKPMSVNKVWKGRRFKTKEYEIYRRDCMWLMPELEMIEDPVIMVMGFFVRYPKMCDVDNFVKPMLDIIVKKGWLKDDRLVYVALEMKIETKKEERSVVAILPMEASWEDVIKKVVEIKSEK